MSGSERAIHVGLLIAALAAAGWAFSAHGHAPGTTNDSLASPLSLVPPGSAFVLTADVHRLEHAPLGRLLAQRLGHVGGSSQLATLCGFDPLARLDHLMLAVPSAILAAEAHPEDFGIVASGRFSAAEIMHCASAAIRARQSEPIRAQLGSFSSVRDRTQGGGEVAARDGGLLLVSGGSYFRALLDAAEGNAPKLEHPDTRAAQHADLRHALAPAPLLATWLLGEGWFERVAGDASNARLSPLRAIRAVGASVDTGNAVHVSVLLDCTDSDGASRISSLLSELRSSLDALPVDPALAHVARRIAVSQTSARLTLSLNLAPSELQPLLDLLLGPA